MKVTITVENKIQAFQIATFAATKKLATTITITDDKKTHEIPFTDSGRITEFIEKKSKKAINLKERAQKLRANNRKTSKETIK